MFNSLARLAIPILICISLLVSGCIGSDVLTLKPSTVAIGAGKLVLNEIVANASGGNPDWIELYNSGNGSVELSLYSLVDDNRLHAPFSFPPGLFLAPGEFIVVIATDKDPGDGSYWTGFKLGEDDAVNLLRGNQVIETIDWEKGNAPEDQSLGHLPDGTGPWETLVPPTPGKANRLDSPFVTDRVVEVRIVMSEEDWATTQRDYLAQTYVPADFYFDGERVSNVAIRPKGNSSLRIGGQMVKPRFSFKVDFNRYQDQTFRGLKKLVFNNGFHDPTLLRERIVYDLFTEVGIVASRTSHVDLWVNDTHLGVYTQIEQVDRTFLLRNFGDDSGDLYKPEPPASYLNWTGADLESGDIPLSQPSQPVPEMGIPPQPGEVPLPLNGIPPGGRPPGGQSSGILGLQTFVDERGESVRQQLDGEQPSSGDGSGNGGDLSRFTGGIRPGQRVDYLGRMTLQTNEDTSDHSSLLRFLDVLNNTPDEEFPTEIEKVLDVDAALRFLAVSAMLVHLDNYTGRGSNYYLYEVDGKFTIIPWDLNETFGNFNCGINREGLINLLIDEPT